MMRTCRNEKDANKIERFNRLTRVKGSLSIECLFYYFLLALYNENHEGNERNKLRNFIQYFKLSKRTKIKLYIQLLFRGEQKNS